MCLDGVKESVAGQAERNISRLEVLYALKHGFHEKRKDAWDELHQAWNYSIRAKTFERRMLIITAIDLDR